MLNCKNAAALMSQARDRELSPGEQLSLRLHLMLCAGCRRVDRQLDVLREACRRFSSGEARDL